MFYLQTRGIIYPDYPFVPLIVFLNGNIKFLNTKKKHRHGVTILKHAKITVNSSFMQKYSQLFIYAQNSQFFVHVNKYSQFIISVKMQLIHLFKKKYSPFFIYVKTLISRCVPQETLRARRARRLRTGSQAGTPHHVEVGTRSILVMASSAIRFEKGSNQVVGTNYSIKAKVEIHRAYSPFQNICYT